MTMLTTYSCPICGNTDIHSIGMLNGMPYCRRCIIFKGAEVEHKQSYPKQAPIHLEYELSQDQKELSDKLVENYKKGIDSLVYAVTGSGKTEISLQIMQYAIRCGEKVAFALPRRDVAIELYNRLKEIFRFNKVICLYGGHTEDKEGDIVVLTTHQLYRYKHYFSLIILDEIDAFPFKDNPVLHQMFFQSLCGHYVMMSATPSDVVIRFFKQKDKDILYLSTRFHRHPLPVPKIYKMPMLKQYLFIIKKLRQFKKEKKQVFVFAPTIELCEKIYRIISLFVKGGNYVHSKRKNRTGIINSFREKFYDYLVTTSVLERGVTVGNLQVIIAQTDHKIYEKGVLVQISGRVGRKKNSPKGEVIYLSKTITKNMTDSIFEIRKNNEALLDG